MTIWSDRLRLPSPFVGTWVPRWLCMLLLRVRER